MPLGSRRIVRTVHGCAQLLGVPSERGRAERQSRGWVFPPFTRPEVGWGPQTCHLSTAAVRRPRGDSRLVRIAVALTSLSGAFQLRALWLGVPQLGRLRQRGVQTRCSTLAPSSLLADGRLSEVSGGPVPGQASFRGPRLAGVCRCVGRPRWVLPAPRGAHLPGRFRGSHCTGRYPAQLFAPLENDSIGRTFFIGHLPLLSKVPIVKITSRKAARQSS